jgi:hypothetical protein
MVSLQLARVYSGMAVVDYGYSYQLPEPSTA